MTMRMSIPVGTHDRGRATGHIVRRWLRLFAIELLRGQGVFLATGVAAITAWVMWDIAILDGVVRWRDVSRATSDPLWITTTFVAAGASWLAARDERRGIVDLLETTSTRQVARDLASLMSVVLWSALGYLAVVVSFFVYAAINATWGGPQWNQTLLVVISLPPAIMFGWLCGAHVKHRLTPLFVAVAIAAMHIVPVTIHNARMQQQLMTGVEPQPDGHLRWERLMPVEIDYSGELWQLFPLFTVWMLSLAGVLWGTHRILSKAMLHGLASTTLSILLAGSAAFALVRHEPVSNDRLLSPPEIPVCTTRLDDTITVCLHPENETLLDETADVIWDIVEPIAGLPGVHMRYQQVPTEGDSRKDFVPISLYDRSTLEWQIPFDVVQQNLWLPRTLTPAQVVVGAGLLGAGSYEEVHEDWHYPSIWAFTDLSPHVDAEAIVSLEEDIDTAIDRFAALSPEAQRIWLESNWIALTSGALSLEDLP